MKRINKILIGLVSILTLSSCGGLNKYERNGQYERISYAELDQMVINDESFVFFLTKTGCPGCKEFYPVVEEFLQENSDLKIYSLNRSEMEPTDEFILASYYVDTLGSKYFEDTGRDTLALYTPSICKVVNGEFVYAQIGGLDKSTLEKMYQDNYLSISSFYMLNKKVTQKQTFNIFISTKDDQQYDDSLRQYFVNNSNDSGYYLNASKFDETDNEKLLNRINYYLGEGNEIETLPEYCLLQYEKGVLINYSDVKYDEASLNTLYNK